MMVKVHVLVEGQTEEEFVRQILDEYLSPKGIYLNPVIAKTKRAISGNSAFRGGMVSYGKIAFDLKQLLRDSSASLVTTMIDFYRLPADFPGFTDEEAKTGSPHQCVRYLEDRFRSDINHPRFLPYLSIHEFEALLFSEPEMIVREIRGDNQKAQESLRKVLQRYNSPEEINRETPPSKHILEHLSEYDKTVHGYLIAIEIGVDRMRHMCPHFHEWLARLEALAIL
jgi:hypothetical protein